MIKLFTHVIKKKKNTILNIIKKEFEENGSTNCRPGIDKGICMLRGLDSTKDKKEVYYYTGDKQKNYIKLNNKIFYIVRTTEDDGIKLLDLNRYEFELKTTGYTNAFERTITAETDDASGFKFKSGWTYIYLINGYRTSFIYNGCPGFASEKTKSLTNENWEIEDYYRCENENDSSKYINVYSAQNQLYKQLNEWYNNLNIDHYTKNTFWCKESRDSREKLYTKCLNNNERHSIFGLLSLEEYFLVVHGSDSSTKLYEPKTNTRASYHIYDVVTDPDKGPDDLSSIFELTSDCYNNTYQLMTEQNHTYHYYYEHKIYYRPSFVIKNDLIIISGDGSLEHPYEVSSN